MTIRAFLTDRLGRLVAMGVGAAGSAAFLWATGTAWGVVVLLLIGWALAAGGLLVWDYLRLARRLRLLRQTLAGLDQKYLLTECVPPPMGSYERALFALQRQAGKSMVETVSAAQAAQRDYREYVETWVHEVKTPITAARLLCRGLEGPTRRRLEGELAQIEAHVERALFYARAESPEKDLVVRPTPLAELVRQAVQAHRTLLIQNGVRVEAEAVAGTVYTDEKWAAFLLGQLLQNAARYRRDRPVITLTAQPLGDRVALTVADNGLGIPAQELPRIFDRGFTGTNGRQRGGATGMGLYLARQVAEALAIDLQAASQVGEGSVFTLTFPAPENLTKS